jgi:putative transcriptional regulator
MNNLKNLRKKNSLTQQDIAELLKITKSAYCNKENGLRKFNTQEAISLSKLFETPIEAIENFLTSGTQNEYVKAS